MTGPTSGIMPGCEPISHRATGRAGAVVIHGFTGSPYSVRGVADAMITAGFDVEVPRLPGHGTSIDDMATTGWADWTGEAERALASLTDRVGPIVVVGQSMGATVALHTALRHRSLRGVICINPLTRPRADDEMAAIDELIDDGFPILPGGASDIADPDARDVGYEDTPLHPLRSLLIDGVGPITGRFGELTMPLRLFTSRQDHVVAPADSEHLASTWGGTVEHTWLDRSFHVATLDYERDVVERGTVEFALGVTA